MNDRKDHDDEERNNYSLYLSSFRHVHTEDLARKHLITGIGFMMFGISRG